MDFGSFRLGFLRKTLWLVIFSLFFCLAGCRLFDSFNDSGSDKLHDSDSSGFIYDYELKPDTIDVASRNLVLAGIASDTYIFVASGTNPIKPGSIIIGYEEGGFLKRVKTVVEADGKITVETENAILADAFEHFQLSYKGKLSEISSISTNLIAEKNPVGIAQTSILKSSIRQAKAGDRIDSGIDPLFECELDLFKFDWDPELDWHFKMGDPNYRFILAGPFEANLELTIKMQMAKTFTLSELKLFHAEYILGPGTIVIEVPFDITIKPELSGSYTFGYRRSFNARFGVIGELGGPDQQIYEITDEYNEFIPDGEIKGALEATVTPAFEVGYKIFGLVGAKFGVEVILKWVIEWTNKNFNILKQKITLGLQVPLTIMLQLFSMDIAEIKFVLAKKELLLWEKNVSGGNILPILPKEKMLASIKIDPVVLQKPTNSQFILTEIKVIAHYENATSTALTDVLWNKKYGDGTLHGKVFTCPSFPGTSILTCTYEENGIKKSADLQVTFKSNIVEPVVKIISPSNGDEFVAGNPITIIANASDADGKVQNVAFYQEATKLGAVVFDSISSPYSYTWQNPPVGRYSLTAFATDDSGASSNSNVVDIVVNPPNNIPPLAQITSPIANSTFASGSDIAISVSASDPDGTVAKVEFYQSSTKLGESVSAPYQFVWNNVSPGSYSITAFAIDNAGAWANSSVVDIFVNPPVNIPPSVQITSPTANSEYIAGNNITISAEASDSDGTVAIVEFFQNSTKLGESISPPYQFTWNNVPEGTYNITAMALDDDGAHANSEIINISVSEAAPSDLDPPVLLSSIPASGALMVDMPVNTVSLYFSEPIKKGLNGNIVIKSLTDNTIISTIPINNEQIQIEGNCLKIAPSFFFQSTQDNKAPAKDYKLEIAAGAILDMAENSFAGFSGESALKFGVQLPWFFATAAAFGPLREHTSVVFNNKMWVIGGANAAPTTVSKVYSSPDGINWTLVSDGKFSTRWCHASVVFNGQMWIFGGMGDSRSSAKAEALSSSDGKVWNTRSTLSFLKRTRHSAVVFKDKVWILGGQKWISGSTYQNLNDVWSSSDGVSWTQETASAPWTPAWTSGRFECLVYDQKMWVIAQNKVWNSSDGANWTFVSAVPSPFWALGSSSYVFDDRIWIVGGYPGADYAFYSKDGLTWIRCSDVRQDLPDSHSGVVFKNRMWIMGGRYQNDVRTNYVQWAW